MPWIWRQLCADVSRETHGPLPFPDSPPREYLASAEVIRVSCIRAANILESLRPVLQSAGNCRRTTPAVAAQIGRFASNGRSTPSASSPALYGVVSDLPGAAHLVAGSARYLRAPSRQAFSGLYVWPSISVGGGRSIEGVLWFPDVRLRFPQFRSDRAGLVSVKMQNFRQIGLVRTSTPGRDLVRCCSSFRGGTGVWLHH